MNVDYERTLKQLENEETPQTTMTEDEKQRFEQLLDIMGIMGGYDESTFAEEKEAILNSGISLGQFTSILGDNLNDKIGPREIVNLPVQKLTDTARLPKYAHGTDACADLYAAEALTLQPGATAMIGTGLAFAVPEGYVVHIYPRSSIGAKTPLRLSNSVGVIDAGYRDELKIIYTNTGTEPFNILVGDRIAQMSIDLAPMARFRLVEDVKEYGEDRMGGIGSTGVN